MPAPKKTTRKKPASPAKASPAKANSAKRLAALKEGFTKTQLLKTIADNVGITKKQVSDVFEELNEAIERHVKKRSVGEFTLPGLLKIRVVRKPATKARKGINPFTKEPTVFKAKPARNVVKIKPLKRLKDMVE